MRGLLALLFGLALLVGCDDGDDVAGPSVPNIAGNWSGTWQDGNVSTTLQQSGSSVTGTLQFGSAAVYDIAGTVDEAGIFAFGGSYTAEGQDGNQICRFVETAGSHLAISADGNRMSGLLRHWIPDSCDDPESVQPGNVQQGDMILDRVL